MSTENIYRLIHFDEYSVTPKYLQLTQSILKGIEEGKLEKDYILPSKALVRVHTNQLPCNTKTLLNLNM